VLVELPLAQVALLLSAVVVAPLAVTAVLALRRGMRSGFAVVASGTGGGE
jgi:hypothetical protein